MDIHLLKKLVITRLLMIEASSSTSAPETEPAWAEKTKDEDPPFVDDGPESVPEQPGSEPLKQASASGIRTLTQQRQQQLDKGDAVAADETGRQLSSLRKNRG